VGTDMSRRVVSLNSDESLVSLETNLDALAHRLEEDQALGLILIDASPLTEIERVYGSDPLRRVLVALAQRIQSRLTKDFDGKFFLTCSAIEEERLMVFLHAPRSDAAFYTRTLPVLAEELRSYVGECLRKIVYPYLPRAPAIAVGHGFCLQRSFHRPEAQICQLIRRTLALGRYETERMRRDREATLARMLLEESLFPIYQPIVALEDHAVLGFEALVRGPLGSGLESPLTLFEVAESSDLVFELDNLCRRQALRNARGLKQNQKLFLNILASSVYDPEFDDAHVRARLEELNLGPSNLVLEISERHAIQNFAIFGEVISRFSNLGFGIAIDDIGAGFSSLVAVLELNPHFLKIDMALVRGIDDDPHRQEVLHGMQALAQRMDAAIIAEGVETREEMETLHELGIRYAQGFLLGRGGPTPRLGSGRQ
jgi:EAL domain-containing protein (putative c-di-GMP-specific phosphodiesterase class I)/GGDEF domain-containing protein